MPKRTIHILLLEDSKTDAGIIIKSLVASPMAIRVTHATTLAEARALLAENIPDLALVDIFLPDGKGTELLPRDGETGVCPIVIMTGSGDEQTAVDSLKSGALDYISKNRESLKNIPYIVERALREWGHVIERKRAEEALRESEERFRSIFESSPAAMVIISPHGPFLYANPSACRTFGYSGEELSLLTINDITHPDDREKSQRRFKELLTGKKEVIYYEKRYLTKDGSILWGNASLSCVRDRRGAPLYLVAQMFNITERKKAEEALLRANRDLEAFTSTVSHDLRSSLAPLVNIPPLLIKRNSDLLDSDDLKMLVLMQKRAKRMQKIMDDLLILARVGFLKSPSSPVNVEEIVQDLLQELSSDIAAAGIVVRVGPLPELRVPSTFLVQIFGNLIKNAIKYAGSGGNPIEIGGEQKDNKFIFFVLDHGPGISEEERSRIFYPFYRSRAEVRSDGTGIGLAIVDKIASLCNGRVWVDETDGGGSTFRIELMENVHHDSLKSEHFEESDAKYRSLFTQSAEAILLLTDRFFECNEQACRLFGGDRSSIIGHSPAELSPPFQPDGRSSAGKARELIEAAFKGETEFFPWQHRRQDGSLIDTEISLKAINYQGKKVIQATIRDVTERKRLDENLLVQKTPLQRLLNVLQHNAANSGEILDYTLHEAIELTGSQLGHIFLYDEEKQLFTRNSSSGDALAACNIINPKSVYQLEKTGMWGEAVRQRRAVIVNDYMASNPMKKGCPEGHVELKNFMTVPLFVNDRIVAVVGLANRPTDFEEIDAARLNILMNAAWKGVERKQLVEALRKGEELYRTIFETTGTATVIIERDTTISLANDEFALLSGYSREDIEGKMSWTVFVGKDDKERMMGYHRARRFSPGVAPIHYEFDFVDRNGAIKKIYNSVNMIPNSARSVMSCQDITEWKRAEEELNDRMRQAALGMEVGVALTTGGSLKAMLQQCAEAIVTHLDAAFARIWTLNGKGDTLELLASAGMYTHLDGPHALVPVGKYKIGMIVQEKKPHLTNSAVGDPRIHDQEWAIREGMVAFAGHPLVVADKVVGVMAMFSRKPLKEDALNALAAIADEIALGIVRKQTEEQMRATQARLIHANKMSSLGLLVSGIAHEINNPNSFVKGNAAILEKIWREVAPILADRQGTAGDISVVGFPLTELEEVVPRLLKGLGEGARRISAIVDNLKEFAREEADSALTPFDVNAVIRAAALILSHHIHCHTDNFRLDLSDVLPQALGKSQQVEQVVINLVMNALQALTARSEGVTVTSRLDPISTMIEVSVRDEGEGMTKDVQERLIEPFFSTRFDQGGSGLGLSIAETIVKGHNGELRFDSAPGKGTLALFTLPPAPGDPKQLPSIRTKGHI